MACVMGFKLVVAEFADKFAAPVSNYHLGAARAPTLGLGIELLRA